MNTWKAILAALVIFGAGLGTGAVLTKVFAKPPAPAVAAATPVRPANSHTNTLPLEHLRRLELMQRVQKDLDLTPEQREHIEKIIGDGQEHIKELWEEVAPDIHDELQDIKKKLCAELTPEQLKRFEELTKHPRKPTPAGTNAPPAAPAPAPAGAGTPK